MSRIGRKPIPLPQGVTVTLSGDILNVKGPKGELNFKLPAEVNVEVRGGHVQVEQSKKTKKSGAIWGTMRSVIANLIQGVTQGFEKHLEIQGLGYRAAMEGNTLVLSLGYAHPVKVVPPPGITFRVDKNIIIVSGIDKVLVGNVAYQIRALKKPEPYKGKGIRYEGEIVRKKAGKKAVAAAK